MEIWAEKVIKLVVIREKRFQHVSTTKSDYIANKTGLGTREIHVILLQFFLLLSLRDKLKTYRAGVNVNLGSYRSGKDNKTTHRVYKGDAER